MIILMYIHQQQQEKNQCFYDRNDVTTITQNYKNFA